MSLRTAPELAADYPIDNADLQGTIDKIDFQTQNGFLAGAALSQALAAVGTAMDAYAETAPPPTAIFTGTAGSAPVSRYYAALIEYPLTIDPTSTLFPKRAVKIMPGAPAAGRGRMQADRTKRYSRPSASVTVSNTSTALNATDYVTVTAPAYAGTVAGVTFSLLAVDVNGNLLYSIGSGIAPGATAIDLGPMIDPAAVGTLPLHTEFAIVPASPATGTVTVTGTFAAGGVLEIELGGITASHTVAAGDNNSAGVASALAAAIGAAQPLVGATAAANVITITAVADGPAGNLSLSYGSTSPALTLVGPLQLAGGTAGGPVYGPRTAVTGTSGV